MKYKYKSSKILEFILAADKDILQLINSGKINDFEKLLFSYQLKHYDKYGNYLIF